MWVLTVSLLSKNNNISDIPIVQPMRMHWVISIGIVFKHHSDSVSNFSVKHRTQNSQMFLGRRPLFLLLELIVCEFPINSFHVLSSNSFVWSYSENLRLSENQIKEIWTRLNSFLWKIQIRYWEKYKPALSPQEAKQSDFRRCICKVW